MASPGLAELVGQLQQLHAANTSAATPSKAVLTQAKVQLAQAGLLLPSKPSPQGASIADLEAAREILSYGALLSVREGDFEAFQRYIQQVKPFWDPQLGLSPSQLQPPLTGLSLLRLLANNDIAGFHTLLEELAAKTSIEDLHSNAHIKYPLDLERWLMEGSYSRVWSTRSSSPMPEYSIFLDQLVTTVRNEIASCSEKAYSSLPLSDAAVLLFFQNRQELLAFANTRPGWKINPTSEIIEFQGTGAQEEQARQDLPKGLLVEHMLSYAKELETIV